MWTIEMTDLYERRQKRYGKKRPRELGAVLENLETYFESLNAGMTVQKNVFGFVHPEPQGVKAIDQRGVVKGKLAETRLYIYPNEASRVLYVITLGDKDSQPDDIEACKEFVAGLRE